ncbi:MAG: quinone-dependent dihydroorotate dehydrogenase [Campylobacter sp.]|nr:quinone-dependent dihydroorotate dehydrogenase [Campylobacter sp.]
MNYDSIKKVFFKFQPETAHKIAETAMRATKIFPGILSFSANKFCFDDEALYQEILGMKFYNPVGLAGGFDKNATMISPLTSLGFSYIEYGTLTKESQSGNDKPRLFRLPEIETIVNHMGFNNDGAKIIKQRVEKLYPFSIPLIANIGKNKTTPNEDAHLEYEFLLKEFDGVCDAFVINISSPNTPNLRELQNVEFLKILMSKSLTQKPIFLKIAPDMSVENALNLCKEALNLGIKGIIINNTSVDYSLINNRFNTGGISGNAIKEKSREFFKALAKELFGKCVLISSGGIDSADEAYTRIKDGANLVQIYSSFIFKGPSIARDINEGLKTLLEKDGFENIQKAVGANLNNKKES